jgi:hypothetical protein
MDFPHWPYSYLNTSLVITLLALLPCASAVIVVTYRLTAHPLAKFPGPKLASATGLYEAYYQCLKDGGGRYWKEIERMHRLYGA